MYKRRVETKGKGINSEIEKMGRERRSLRENEASESKKGKKETRIGFRKADGRKKTIKLKKDARREREGARGR